MRLLIHRLGNRNDTAVVEDETRVLQAMHVMKIDGIATMAFEEIRLCQLGYKIREHTVERQRIIIIAPYHDIMPL